MLIPISSTLNTSVRFAQGASTWCFEVDAYLYLPCDSSGRIIQELSQLGVWVFDEQLDAIWGDRGTDAYKNYRYRKQSFTAGTYDDSLAAAYQAAIATTDLIAELLSDGLTAQKMFDVALKRLTRGKHGA